MALTREQRWRAHWRGFKKGFKKGPFVPWEDAFFFATVGTMVGAIVGRYLRGDVIWPEVLAIVAVFGMITQIKWWKRRRREQLDVLARIAATAKELAPDSKYIIVLVGPDWVNERTINTHIISNLPDDDHVRYFFRRMSEWTGPSIH